ncbi:MAG: glycosyltransferase [Actinomycetota bacterium]
MSKDRPHVTMVTSNGWGLGHLNRAIAIALAMDDRAEVTMFSFSRGLPLASQFGIKGEFCPGPSSAWVPGERWNLYVERRFGLFMSEVEPDVVLFDGVAPYFGIINALRDRPAVSAGWIRRGMWLPQRTKEQLAKAVAFDFVVEPGDLAAAADRGPTPKLEAIRVASVSLLDVVPMLDREDAAAELGVDPARPTLLCSVGSGQPGDMDQIRELILERAGKHEEWQVGLVNSPLSTEDATHTSGAIQLRGVYPLVRYLNAFDAAVSAAGYNSVHELIPAGVPTLLVPKSASKTDDQLSRASFLANGGKALMARDDDPDEVSRQVDVLLGEGRSRLQASLMAADRAAMTGGAGQIAEIVTGSPPTGIRDTERKEVVPQPGIKGFLRRVIGPEGVRRVQRVLGREPEKPPRTAVSLNRDSPDLPWLVVTSDPETVPRSAEHPVEHVLPDATAGYEDRRRALLEDFYEIVR